MIVSTDIDVVESPSTGRVVGSAAAAGEVWDGTATSVGDASVAPGMAEVGRLLVGAVYSTLFEASEILI